ncbi:unnamed protein product, partial [Rotaria sp. Silwood1]
MLLYVLKQMTQDEQSKKDMLNKCRDYYQFDRKQLEKIEQFRNSYSRDRAIEWYTNECFLYKLLNKALRTEDIELLYSFRFFIIDLCLEIERESKELDVGNGLTLYRGQMVSVEEFEKLKKNVGKLISMNSFWSTSRSIQVARVFAPADTIPDNIRSILFEIEVDSSVKTVVCADINHRTQIPEEREVLFSLNSVFEIVSVNFDKEFDLWKIQLKTTDEGSKNVEEYAKSIERGVDYDSPMIYFGRLLLYELSQIDQAEKYFKILLKSLPSDHSDIASVYNWIGVVHDKRNNFDQALEYYEKAYAIRQEQLPSDHPDIAKSLYDFGTIAERKKNFDQAINYYAQALNIDEKNYIVDLEHKAQTIKKIGMVYRQKGDLNMALKYVYRALEMFRRILPAQHPQIAMCLINIGMVHRDQGNFDKALDYFHQKLEMDEQCLPSDHPYHSRNFDLVVKTYQKKGEIEKALDFCQKKLGDQKNILGENHPRIAQMLMAIAKMLADTALNRALEYYDEALSILEQTTPADCETITHYLAAMDSVYSKYCNPINALPRLLKAFDLSRRIPHCDHISIANISRNIALRYEDMKKSSEALYYFNESLSIYQA